MCSKKIKVIISADHGKHKSDSHAVVLNFGGILRVSLKLKCSKEYKGKTRQSVKFQVLGYTQLRIQQELRAVV